MWVLFASVAMLACLEGQKPEWSFTPTGAVSRLSFANSLLLQNFGVVLVKPGWQGSYADQLNPETVKVTFKANGEQVWSGTLRGDGAEVDFVQKATVKANEIVLAYEFRPRTEVSLETLMLRCFLPTEVAAGKAIWVAFDEFNHEVWSGNFPETLPEPYHLFGRSQVSHFLWALQSGALLFDLRESNLAGINLQDDRRFGMNAFELQLHLKFGKLRVGEKVASKLKLVALGAEDAKKWVSEVKERAERERTFTLQKRAPLRLKAITPNAQSLRRYELLEVRIDLDATYDNPFDPEQISVEAEFIAPSGKRITVPGFFTQDFERVVRDGREILRKVGSPYFAVRFTPVEVGTYHYRIVAMGHGTGDKGQETGETVKRRNGDTEKEASQWLTLKVLPNPQAKGFVRRGRFWHLQFEDGTPFIPVGLNVCWSGNNLSAYERWFEAMRKNGANFARIWLVRWNMGLEWTPSDGNGVYLGLGKYALDNAWRIDELIRIAERNGIYLMLCLGYHGELADRQLYFGEQAWDKNPYNRKNGGPCDKPADFWTNPEARRFYKQRLRYIIARYAHSPNVLAFEFWNEVHAPAHWVKEMAQFVRSIDPYGHLLTTTYGDDEVWQLPEMDFSQTHWYGDGSQRDCVTTIVNIHRYHLERYRKPFLLGEFGIDWRTSDLTYDPKGNALHWHNGMWASLMSGGMGTACVWYWDNYIDGLNLWHHFRPVAGFARLVGRAWLQNWRPLRHTDPIADVPSLEQQFGDFVFTPTLSWQRPTGDTFVLHRNGKVESNGETSVFLFSPSKPDLYRPPKFVVDFPQDGVVAIQVGTVSSGAVLIVRIDGKEVWRQELPEGQERKDEQGRIYREGSYREKRWIEQWRKWDYVYDREFVVPVPKGKHTIEVDNQGADWCTITRIRFSPYRDLKFPEVDIVGIQTETAALIWVHNQQSNFQNEKKSEQETKSDLKPIKDLRFEVLGLKDGKYRIVLWDTWKGMVASNWQAQCRQGRLLLRLPDLERDFALWITSQ
jgi:hypothetical protein